MRLLFATALAFSSINTANAEDPSNRFFDGAEAEAGLIAHVFDDGSFVLPSVNIVFSIVGKPTNVENYRAELLGKPVQCYYPPNETNGDADTPKVVAECYLLKANGRTHLSQWLRDKDLLTNE